MAQIPSLADARDKLPHEACPPSPLIVSILMLVSIFACVGLVIAYLIGRQHPSSRSLGIVPQRVQQALNTLTEGLLVIDEEERIVVANEAFTTTTGLTQEQLIGERMSRLPWVGCVSLKDSSPWELALREGTAMTNQLMLFERAGGERRYLLINCSPIVELNREAHGVLATFRDVTDVELKRVEMERSLAMMRTYRDQLSHQNCELQRLASHDPLTGCMNRRAFFCEVQPILGEAQLENADVACLMIDSDHFKQINDTHGHGVGDEVLRRIAAVLRDTIATAGPVCRYGGEEFCVILPGKNLESARVIAEQLRVAIESLRFEEPSQLRLTVSIGVSQRCDEAENGVAMIHRADQCLYAAKQRGRNQVVLDDASVASEAIPSAESQVTASSKTGRDFDGERMIPFEAVTALVSALAYRDRGTAEHSRRVADLCVLVATNVLDYRSTYVLETAAMLHDIGKIGVPDQILFKPGPLSRDEWKLIRQYDRVGTGIIAGTFNCDELNEVVKCLHTPFGYRASGATQACGPSLPLAARLLAIADSYDSMRTDRSYRKGRSHDDCITELRRYAGIQFDPELVEHFAKVVSQHHEPKCVTSGAIPAQTAMQIGMQIERLARAIDAKDTVGLRILSDQLATMARENRIDAIAVAASKLHAAAEDENSQWMRLLDDTQVLLGLCRATQHVFLATPTNRVAAES